MATSMQHEPDQRVEEELDGGVLAARAAPDADQEVHRQEHHFPEDVEQEEVERDEDAHHAGLQQQEQDEVALDVLLDRPATRPSPGTQSSDVSSTSGRLMPSTPRKYSMLKERDPGDADRRTAYPPAGSKRVAESQTASSSRREVNRRWPSARRGSCPCPLGRQAQHERRRRQRDEQVHQCSSNCSIDIPRSGVLSAHDHHRRHRPPDECHDSHQVLADRAGLDATMPASRRPRSRGRPR